MKTYKQEWDLKGNMNTAGMNVVSFIQQVIRQELPEYSDFFPFKVGFTSSSFSDNDFYCLQIKESVNQIPHVGDLNDKNVIENARKVFEHNHFPSFKESYDVLKETGFAYDVFTYIGEKDGTKLSWPHIAENVIEWLNKIVIPKIQEMNTKRVTDAIPTPPNYDTKKILDNIYVIESESNIIQGTAFHLKGVGLITCEHCIRNEESGEIFNDLKLFRGQDFQNKYSVTISTYNTTLDVAILEGGEELLGEGLEKGTTDSLNQMDHIAISGFPNYNFGDSGIISPGLIVGFRVHSGVSHILINTPLIVGNSGGPAINKDNKVVGIAVTGAEKMSQAHSTEKHGVIPIDSIEFIKK